MALDILVVDDEADIRDLVCGILEDEGYKPRAASDGDAALTAVAVRRPALIILDIWLRGSRIDGLEVLRELQVRDASIPVIIISGHGSIETAVAAIKLGAYDFIEKPFQTDQLLNVVARATERERLKRENEELRSRSGLDIELTGNSPAINAVRSMVHKVAQTGSRVMITGPAGSGKEVAARLIHQLSGRVDAPFVVVSAATMAPETVDLALFGQERDGAVTKTGLFEQAHGGTLFLDEIADMPAPTQARILRVLTEQTFNRVGGDRSVSVDVRVISSSTRDLATEIAAGHFRAELFYRLNVVPLEMPPLTERRDDIPALAEYFAKKLAAAWSRKVPRISPEALAVLQAFNWPGNVRQLRNVMERTLIMAPLANAETIDVCHLPDDLSQDAARLSPSRTSEMIMSSSLRDARETFEREYLRVQIRRFSGNISRTAHFVGMERSALHRKLKALGLGSEAERGNDEEVDA